MEQQLDVSVSPHIKDKANVQKIMLDVIIALIPAGIAGVYIFGIHSLYVILTCVIMAVISEWVIQKIVGVKNTVDDLSAVVTGILLAYCLPPSIPLWIAGIGAVAAIVIVKNLFGGLGYNIFNPALASRAILLASWPAAMTYFIKPQMSFFGAIDTVASATPLTVIKGFAYKGLETSLSNKEVWFNLILGMRGGAIGETSCLAILLGGIYLLFRKVIDWRIPFTFIGTVLVMSFILGRDPLFNIFTGGVFLGAFFMATDYVTSPVTPLGRLIFGIFSGLLVVLIRFYGGYPEGVCYSILIMNIMVPTIDKFTVPKTFGH
ncbi:MAG: RnfABCDGE type electron transport complex subunit D [bacterium]|nr:RnfABCDGE type electron transport complex subunit D [bacterium]